jgi:hypothetical protein
LIRMLGGGMLSASAGQRFQDAVKTAHATALPRSFGYRFPVVIMSFLAVRHYSLLHNDL